MTQDSGFERERELERLLAKANLHRLRGQLLEAEDTCRQALALNPEDVLMREMLGDALYDAGKLDAALAEYRFAQNLAPGRESVEKKFARVTLDIADRERQKSLAADMLLNPNKYAPRERSPALAFMASFIPGLGQFYNGEFVKAAIIFGAFLLFMLSYAVLQHGYPPGIMDLYSFLNVTSPAVRVTFFAFILAYIYGIIDAPVAAGRTVRKREPKAQPKDIEPSA